MRAESAVLLVRRIRSGLWLLLVALVLFGIDQRGVDGPASGPLGTVKVVQLATIVGVAWMVRGRPEWRRAVGAALLILVEVSFTTAVSGILRDEVGSTILVLTVLVMATATLLPWGLWPQAVTVAAVVVACTLNALAAPSGLPAGANPLAIAMTIAAVTSLYLAHEFERHRTEQRAAEEQLRASEARKSAIVESALDSIVGMDSEGRIVEFNPAAERTFGHARAAVVGASLADVLVPPTLRDQHQAGLARYLRTGDRHVIGRRIETVATRADGSEFPVELAITRVVGDGPPRFTGYLRDLTERRLAQEAKISATLVRAGREMMSLLDVPLILERLCLVATEALQCDASHVLLWQPERERYETLAEHGEPPELRAALRALSLNRGEIEGLLGQLQRHDSVQVIASEPQPLLPPELLARTGVAAALYVPLRTDDRMLGVLALTHHRRREPFTAEEHGIARGLGQIASMALTNATLVAEVEHASRIKSEFLSTMSHELRTPLNAILGYAELLQDGGDDDERREFLGRIHTKGRELLELVEGTLEIGDIEAGRAGVHREIVALPALWAAAGDACRELPRGADVAVDWDTAVPRVLLRTDPRKLVIVVRNLVSNALKFTEHGSVRIGARADGSRIAIRVADTGIGIAPEDRAVVFDLFRQADGSESRRFGGAGLGLYVVRRFVEQLGGTVELDSAPGRGSTFTVLLPVHEPLATEAHPG